MKMENQLKRAIDTDLSGVRLTEDERIRLMRCAMEGKHLKVNQSNRSMTRKIRWSAVILTLLLLMSVTAVAAGVVYYGQAWYYDYYYASYKENNPEQYAAIMANLTEPTTFAQQEDDLVAVTVQDVSWVPEEKLMTLSVRISARQMEICELHPMMNLDADGAYMGPDGPIEPGSEEHLEHYLWTDEGYGPVAQMMDDPARQLILFDPGTLELNGMPSSYGYNVIRVEESDTQDYLLCFMECHLDWLDPLYDEQQRAQMVDYPGHAEEFEARIQAAQQARKLLAEQPVDVKVTLSYAIIPYEEGNDAALYGKHEERIVEMLIRTK